MQKRLNIGVTLFVPRDGSPSIWSNGAVQNILFLYFMLLNSPDVGEVWLINAGDGERLSSGLMLDDLNLPLPRLSEVVHRLDVLIEAGAQISAQEAAQVSERGGVVVAYRCGNDYVMDVERLCFKKPSGSIFNGTRFDEVWTHAQHENTCRSYWEIGMRAPVRVMPHIWSPFFLDRAIAELGAVEPTVTFGYQPRPGPKRVAIFEPNMNVVKNSILPMLVCEAAHRADPSALREVYVTNALPLKEHITFQHFANALDIVRDRIASFEARYNLPVFLSRYTDVVVAHQWENGLNYLYYDALYGGYPLVHNSTFLGKAGYFYNGFDAAQGGEALLRAIRHHDQNVEAYQAHARAVLNAVRIDNPDVVRTHIDRLHLLLNRKTASTVAAL